MTNLLFICSRNQWRSPTAERVFRNTPGVSTRSAGTSPRARRTVNHADVRWADVIIVMEHKHRQRMLAAFDELIRHKPLHVLDIPDDYSFMGPDLVEILEDCVPPLLEA